MKYIPTALKKEISIDNIVSVHYHEYTADFSYAGESHDFFEMIYCDKGELEITAGEKMFRLSPSTAYIHPPKQYHNVRTANSEAASSIVLSFNCEGYRIYDVSDRVIECDKLAQAALAAILRESKASFENIQEVVFDSRLVRRTASSAFASEQVLGCYIELFFIHLIRQNEGGSAFAASQGAEKNEQVIKRVCDYMNEHISEKLTFEDIVSVSLVSATTLKQLFKRSFGHGAMEHLSFMRTERAKELLRDGKYSCTEIASMCGFFSVHHFCRVFKGRYDMPPTQYVKTVKARLEYPAE